MTGLPTDVHPVPRRVPPTPAALDLLAQAERGLGEAASLSDPGEAYVAAHLAALRAAAAVLAVRGRPEPTARGRRRIRSVWEVLPEIAPELAEWSVLFAASAERRARIEAGIRGVATRGDADDLRRAGGFFLRLVEEMLLRRPVPRPDRLGGPTPSESGGGSAAK
ncbi:SAV_6107 family HEPN domain-containing protein [Streptomyces sp. NBC_01803]|uniref:SAV_6107 family HEPN domain-containing protein n=1 Tax=Streptomyces sp. NBC_01803 TaxID=2975946 RepID=UPI002DD961F3|nr:SAV_6107 family HEPN domain-containing protein [Streptomyces sp. NBC_01803]WSA46643.1 SAV_6107 family HEPN domain-containing protein [Streptomyces sp. NBC_01803]